MTMRLWTCLGLAVLGLCACAQLPALLRLEVAGSTLEFKKEPVVENGIAANVVEGSGEGDEPGR
jgi:hypothetical protein